MPTINYTNGNCSITLSDDGTKTREWEGEPLPEFPESIDLKITECCTGVEGINCRECHENSTPQGEHAKTSHIAHILNGLPEGVEIAVGGGDPLRHPHIETILHRIHNQGFICNMTVNAAHLTKQSAGINNLTVSELRKLYGIKGLGISFVPEYGEDIHNVSDTNTVVHCIAGKDKPQDVLGWKYPKILILGFKKYGRGANCDAEKIENNLKLWRYSLGTICRRIPVVSFDNLAIEQLDVKGHLPEELWKQFYMGPDGLFSMYIDAVKNEFAVSSVSPRMPLNGMTAKQAFKEIQCAKSA